MLQKYAFISYSSQNTSDAENVKRLLEDNNISCWMAKYDIPGGNSFSTEIIQAIDGCSVFLLLVTREAQVSQWVPKELDYAIGKGKFILPLLMDGDSLTAFTLQLTDVQCIRAYRRRNEAYKELIARIREELNGKPRPKPPAPVVPYEKDKNKDYEKKNYENKNYGWVTTVFAVAALIIAVFLLISIGSGSSNQDSAQGQGYVDYGGNAAEVNQHSHVWYAATCTSPKTCSECGATEGAVLGHMWIEATYDAPKTCSVCGETEGSPLKKTYVYINDLRVTDKYGKLWLMGGNKPSGTVHTDIRGEDAYKDYSTVGYSSGPVYDHRGNQYDRGWFVDGYEYAEYYVEYDLDGKYSTFSFTYAMTADMAEDPDAKDKKQFIIYGDGEILFESNKMSKDGYAQSVSISVEDVHELRIVYPRTPSPSRICAIFDGKLS